MKKLLLILFLLPVMSCANFANKTKASHAHHAHHHDDEYAVYYQGVESEIPAFLFWIGLWWAYGQEQEIKQKQADKSIQQAIVNDRYTKLSQCLQKAVKNQFYQPILSEKIKAYLNQASEREKASDKAILQNQFTQKINQLHREIFDFYATNQSSDEKARFLREKKKQVSEYNQQFRDSVQAFDENLFSPTYRHYFNDKSEFGKALIEQVENCSNSVLQQ